MIKRYIYATSGSCDMTVNRRAAAATTGAQRVANIFMRSMMCLSSVIMLNQVQLYRGITMV